jgi:hypothetical protein
LQAANLPLYAEQVLGGLCFLDKDGAVSLRKKYEDETGKKFPETLLVRSSITNVEGKKIKKGQFLAPWEGFGLRLVSS